MPKSKLTLVGDDTLDGPPSAADIAFVQEHWSKISRVLRTGDVTEPHQEHIALEGAAVFSGTNKLWTGSKWTLSRHDMDPVQFSELWDNMIQRLTFIIRGVR